MRTEIFRENDSVLLVGEGNFSFAVALVKHIPNIKVTATCYESSIAFESGIRNADYLKNVGARVLLDVDGTELSERFSPELERFDKIIFNFPHAGGKMKINRNRELLKGFFISAESILNPTGVVLVSLCNGQGGTPADDPQRRWDDSWQIVEISAHGNFLLTDIEPFLFHEFPGYSCVGYRSLEKGFDNKNSLVHVFRKSVKPDANNIALRIESSLNLEEGVKWKDSLAKLREKDVNRESDVASIYPLSFSFDITFSVARDFSEAHFLVTLYRFAGSVIENVEFLGRYEFPDLDKVTRTYRICYKSLRFPLYRSRVIDIHKNVISKILEDRLNVVVTK